MVVCPTELQQLRARGTLLTKPAVLATQAIANVVKSSFGPSGLDKMMVDDIGVRLALLTPQCASA
jgi:chaperonin GroEL (HSP60 family)